MKIGTTHHVYDPGHSQLNHQILLHLDGNSRGDGSIDPISHLLHIELCEQPMRGTLISSALGMSVCSNRTADVNVMMIGLNIVRCIMMYHDE